MKDWKKEIESLLLKRKQKVVTLNHENKTVEYSS